ncbi:MAG: type II toxin-antitoxin system VapC family toxin [Planctomycetaceae bacterium]|jgi:PIN domain nuclease of toxin-antitoxin system|nr:MAG: type II toxin-antitoxin system VapC family toxin [Planctomycetaceae bacterium]
MNLLLDTHTLLWFLRDDPQLSEMAKKLIEDPGNRKLVSVASCWEIAIKAGLGKLDLAEPSRTLLEREIPANNLEILSISLAHATAVESLPPHHKDPFDRLLIAQSMIEGIPIVGADSIFDLYQIDRRW